MKGITRRKVLLLAAAFFLSGCVVRTYQRIQDRVDQDLDAGNRGYIMGESCKVDKERDLSRTTAAVELEFGWPMKFEKIANEDLREKKGKTSYPVSASKGYAAQGDADYKLYVVEEGDSLQSISKKFYGTSKKWTKIYEANQAVLKGKEGVTKGQELIIPFEK